MKILYILSNFRRTGPINQFFNIVSNLPAQAEISIISLSPEPEDSDIEKFQKLNVRLITLNNGRLKGMLVNNRTVKRLITEIQPDVIHAQGLRAELILAALNPSIPTLTTLRNYPQIDFLMTYGRLRGQWMLKSELNALNKLTRAIACSPSVEANIRDLGITHTGVVENGVNTDMFFPLPEDKVSLRKSLALPENKTIFITVGTLSTRKNPLFLIERFIALKEKYPDVFFVLIGDGPLSDEVAAKVAVHPDRICAPGQVKEVNAYLNASDGFVSASKGEGLPNCALEAMRCRLPLLLSDIDPHKNVIEKDRRFSPGLLYQEGDEADFGHALAKFLQHKTQYSAQAFDLVNAHFTAQSMSRKYFDIYQKLVGEV